MLWVFYAFLTAFSLATADALSKKAMSRSNEYIVVWVREGYALPFLLIIFLFIDVPSLNSTFFLTLLLLLPLEVTALILYVRAIRVSPLSLTIPFLAFSPIFIIIIGFIILGEMPDRSGIAGIVMIVFGAYLLNIKAQSEGLLEPFKAIGKEKGSVLMIIVALIYSVTSTLGKVAILHSSPLFFGFFYPLILTIVLTPIVWFKTKGNFREAFTRPVMFVMIGLSTASMIIFHFLAINLTEVAYMISVKRTSLIFSVLYGKLLFDEEELSDRLLGSSVMLMGVILITLF
jgi:uncharacterized membrane protein